MDIDELILDFLIVDFAHGRYFIKREDFVQLVGDTCTVNLNVDRLSNLCFFSSNVLRGHISVGI